MYIWHRKQCAEQCKELRCALLSGCSISDRIDVNTVGRFQNHSSGWPKRKKSVGRGWGQRGDIPREDKG